MSTSPISAMLYCLIRPWLIACTLIAAIATTTRASDRQEFNEGPNSLVLDLPHGFQGCYAYYPLNLTAVNKGNQPAVWHVEIGGNLWGGRNRLQTEAHHETIVVPPRRTIQRQVMFAMGNNNIGDPTRYLQVNVTQPSGREEPWSVNNHGGSSSASGGVKNPTLISDNAKKRLKQAPETGSGYHREINPATASLDWRGYTPFSMVVLTSDDWDQMPLPARAALGDWVRMGGHLQFIGDIPNDAPATDAPDGVTVSMGSVNASNDANPPRFKNLAGAKQAHQHPHPANIALMSRQGLLQAWLGSDADRLLSFQFIIWPTATVLILFFIMITPINLFVLAPTRKRHRLFRTIPLISLVACGLLAISVFLGDGLGGEGRRLIHVESRAGSENRQFITQWQASRCGALIRTGFTTEDAAFIAPLSELGRPVALEVLTDRIEGSGGWFDSRTTQSHLLQATRPGRGRIEWSGTGGASPTAVSTFDFPMKNVCIPAPDNQWWHAPEMIQGQTTPLRKISNHEAMAMIRTAIDKLPLADQLITMAQRPGHYIAFTDSPPAIDTLGTIDWNDTGIVTGDLTTR